MRLSLGNVTSHSHVHTLMRREFFSFLVLIALAIPLTVLPQSQDRAPNTAALTWSLIWSDEFNGSGPVSGADWIYDTGTGYACSGCPPNWGTGEVEVMSSSTQNVFQSNGNLNIVALHSGTNPTSGWTSGRIETVRTDFQPPPGGRMAIEARIQQPDVNTTNGLGYWPAFWTLGAPFRGNYLNWPSIGEIDIMEGINGRSSLFTTLHCGSNPGGPCNEPTGKSSGERGCPGCQTSFHVYRMEFDKSVAPEEIRWYLDGVNFFTVRSNEVDQATWNNATNHGFFIILNLAIGGGFPAAFGGGPTSATVSGGTLLVDYVRVYYSPTPRIDTVGLISGGCWFFLRNSNSAGAADSTFQYGPASRCSGQNIDNPYHLKPIAGDWDGNGSVTVGLYLPFESSFFLKNTNSARPADLAFQFGPNADETTQPMQPLIGDWNGDGTDTVGLYHAGTGTFYLKNTNEAGPADLAFQYGPANFNNSGWKQLAGDWNGDGVDTVGLYRSQISTFFLKNTNAAGEADLVFQYGPGMGWMPLAGDWNGDGIDTVGFYNQDMSAGTFYLKNSNAQGPADLTFVYGPPLHPLPSEDRWMPLVGAWAVP